MSYRTGDDARVPEDVLKKSSNKAWLERKDFFFPFEISSLH
jgi:hypothetical protein